MGIKASRVRDPPSPSPLSLSPALSFPVLRSDSLRPARSEDGAGGRRRCIVRQTQCLRAFYETCDAESPVCVHLVALRARNVEVLAVFTNITFDEIRSEIARVVVRERELSDIVN